ncbi:hypothetical protein, partial [uncultured Paracoccus sp.]|uniref:hypothetical protein n=1 Tax=uncultured Paracoccus sp. TaxID=189685 RepID=UPI0025DABB19
VRMPVIATPPPAAVVVTPAIIVAAIVATASAVIVTTAIVATATTVVVTAAIIATAPATVVTAPVAVLGEGHRGCQPQARIRVQPDRYGGGNRRARQQQHRQPHPKGAVRHVNGGDHRISPQRGPSCGR